MKKNVLAFSKKSILKGCNLKVSTRKLCRDKYFTQKLSMWLEREYHKNSKIKE